MLRSSLNSLTRLSRQRITNVARTRTFLTTTSSFSRPLPRLASLPVRRAYSTPSDPPSSSSSQQKDPESEKWISVLENTSSAPWLYTLPHPLENRLKMAYTLLFQVIIYLSRPVSPSEAEQFLVAFGALPAPQESEIGRARKAVREIVNAITNQTGSILDLETAEARELKEKEKELFALVGALRTVNDAYKVTEEAPGKEEAHAVKELENWRMFWDRTQPVLLELGMKLDERGYGLDLEELKREEDAAKKEQGQ